MNSRRCGTADAASCDISDKTRTYTQTSNASIRSQSVTSSPLRYRCFRSLLSIVLIVFALLAASPSYIQPTSADFNPYEVLGVSRRASEDEIRRNWKSLAKKCHPDKNREPDADQSFRRITEAYEILTDPAKKADFDKHGKVRTKQQREAERQQQAFRAQQRAYQQQYAQYSQYSYAYGFGMDPAARHRHQQYVSGNDDPNSSSVRITNSNWDHMVMGAMLTQQHVNEGWMIYVHTATSEACRALNPTWAFFARSVRKQFGGLIRMGKVNAEFENALVRRMGSVRVLPTIMAVVYTQQGGEGSVTKQIMKLPVGHMGSITGQQLMDFMATAFFPTDRSGAPPRPPSAFSSSSIPPVLPLMDVTEGLGRIPNRKFAATKLRASLQAFRTEHGTYPNTRTRQVSSPYVHVYIISAHSRPSALMRYAAHLFHANMRFAHISLPLLAPSSTLVSELASNFPGIDLPHSTSEGALLLIQRESTLNHFELLTPDARRVEEDYDDIHAIESLLKPFKYPLIPQLNYDNYWDLCFPHYEAGKSTASKQESPAAHRECLILLAPSQEHAYQLLLPIFQSALSSSSSSPSSSSPSHSPSFPPLPKHIQVGWIDPADQKSFLSWIQLVRSKRSQLQPGAGRTTRSAQHAARLQQKQNGMTQGQIQALLIRTRESKFAAYTAQQPHTGPTTAELLHWVAAVEHGSAASTTSTTGTSYSFPPSSLMWYDGKYIQGGMPYLSETRQHPLLKLGNLITTVIGTPLRWVRDGLVAVTMGQSDGDSGSSASSSALILLLVFTAVFMISTTTMLRFVAT